MMGWLADCDQETIITQQYIRARTNRFKNSFIPYDISNYQLEGKYSLESTDPHESEIRAPPQPLPYLMPIPPKTLFYNKKFITAFLSLGLGNTS